MKHRRRHFGRRAKKPVRWFVSSASYMDPGTDLSLQTNALVPTATLMALHQRNAVATPELIEQVQRHTLETIRGTILVHGDNNLEPDFSSVALYHAGIRVVELLPDGTPPVYDPATSNEADDAWMWLFHELVAPLPPNLNIAIATTYGLTLPPRVEVHVASKRIMRDNEALVLYERATPSAPSFSLFNQTVHRYAYLRTLVSHPE